MRIALAISGKLRCFKYCQARLKQYILDPLKPDVFFYGYENKEGQEQNQKDVKELWSPVDCSIGFDNADVQEILRKENHNPAYEQRKAPTTNMDWFYGQYENLAQVAKMVRRHENREKFRYDVVIRSRCDYFYHRTPTEDELKSAQSGNILIPSEWDFAWVHAGIGVSDAWAMTDSENFQKFATLLQRFPEYFANGCLAHHETATGWHIRALGLNRIKVSPPPMWFEFPAELSHVVEQNRHNY